jgi:hypothetical protein
VVSQRTQTDWGMGVLVLVPGLLDPGICVVCRFLDH